jgi:hypothetical protein
VARVLHHEIAKGVSIMRKSNRLCLGDLVMAAYDAAGHMTRDEQATSMLAACAVGKLLVKAGRTDLARKLADQGN